MQAGGYSPEQSFISNPANGSLAEVKVCLPSLSPLPKSCHCHVQIQLHLYAFPVSPLQLLCRGLGRAVMSGERLMFACPAQIIMSADNGQVRSNTSLWQDI